VKPVLVTGGTGTLGRVVVDQLLTAGRAVRVLSRRPVPDGVDPPCTWVTGDLRRGAGLDPAVADVDTIIHCATGLRGDVGAARNLIAAARRAGHAHLMYISIVGVDRVPFSYYRTKLAVEHMIERCGLPWTIQRATQFHDLILTVAAALARLPVMPVPAHTSFQPIDTRDVAARLVGFATGVPVGRAPDLGGPQLRSAGDLARAYLRATGRRRPVLPVRLPGAVFGAYRQGGHLTPHHRDGKVTFEQYLAERVAPAAGSSSSPSTAHGGS
jgi:uncharacterized protein YbjT (DUF2867 family)